MYFGGAPILPQFVQQTGKQQQSCVCLIKFDKTHDFKKYNKVIQLYLHLSFIFQNKQSNMQFHGNKSSFNFYRKGSDNQENHSQCHAEHEKNQNILSENSNNVDPHQGRMNSFSNENPHSDGADESQAYHCITCNQTYSGIIKCRHNNQENQSEAQMNQCHNKVYSCPFQKCQKKFNLESGLSRHKVVHTGQKPYSCDYENCVQSFNQKSNLNRHKKIHKNQKPFICDKCCKSFTTTTNLKQHSQTHIPKKQQRKHYICQMKGCNKKYLYRCNLKKHKQEHEDPVGLCLMTQNQNQKNVKKVKFEITLSQCNITLQLRQASVEDHSQMKITYDQNIAQNAQIYNPILILPNDQKQEKSNIGGTQKMEEQKIQQMLVRNLEEFFISKPSQISASFYIHPDLIEYSLIVITQVTTLLEEKGTKQIRFFVESKDNFTRCAQNLMEIYFGTNRNRSE